MTFARETGGDLRAGSTMTTAKGKFVSSRASTRSLPPGRAADSDSEGWQQTKFEAVSNRMDDANRVRTH
jgi:hypothetical protein